jgi:hypothetical protein
MNVYLFEKNVNPLQTQKNNRELETIIQECILTTIRESVPTEAIIRAYMDESVEQEEEIIIEDIEETDDEKEKEKEKEKSSMENDDNNKNIDEENIPEVVPTIQNIDEEEVVTKLTFNDMDSVLNSENTIESVDAPKTIERLEDISTSRAIERKLEEEQDDDADRIQIHTELVDLTGFDMLDTPSASLDENVILDGVEELPPI